MKKIFGFENINILDSFKNKKLHNCILLCSKKGTGKSSFIYNEVASTILSQNSDVFVYNKNKIEETNKLILNNSHPDLLVLNINTLDESGKENTSKKEEINVSQVRNIIRQTNYTSSLSKYKVIIIDSIDEINLNGQNALLKTLEEPNKNTFIFVICHNINKVIDTIKSRCITYNMGDLCYEDWKNAIIQENNEINIFSDEDLIDLYEQSNKTVALTLKMIDFNIFDFQEKVLNLFIEKNILHISEFTSNLDDKENFYMFKISMDIIFSKLSKILLGTDTNFKKNNLYIRLIEKININNLLEYYNYYNNIIDDITIYNLSKTHCINVLFNKLF